MTLAVIRARREHGTFEGHDCTARCRSMTAYIGSSAGSGLLRLGVVTAAGTFGSIAAAACYSQN
jgi:hypothetical protein